SSSRSPTKDSNKGEILAAALSTTAVLLASILFAIWYFRRRSKGRELALALPHPMTPPLPATRLDNSFEPPIVIGSDSQKLTDTPPLITASQEQASNLLEQEKPSAEDDNQQPQQLQPDPTTIPQISEEDSPAIAALRAELLAVRPRLAILESAEAEDPPDYVSSYTRGSR
ncbi:hypothetical protein AAF712_016029, partial [Marasmius tenuissimus]